MINIAIDGPAGAGKSTIAKRVAKALGILYLDTGAMYRAMALQAFRSGIDVNDAEAVCTKLDFSLIRVAYQADGMHVYLGEEDVSQAIRENHVSKGASDISKIPEVRLHLVELQRKIAAENHVVLDGRDITSYVLPRAKYKFYLDASPEVRAKRRHSELAAKGVCMDYDKLLAEIIDRDYNDSHRAFAPLTRTEDSIYIDSSDLSIDEVAALILSYVDEKVEE